jgi:hypothetical protein
VIIDWSEEDIKWRLVKPGGKEPAKRFSSFSDGYLMEKTQLSKGIRKLWFGDLRA